MSFPSGSRTLRWLYHASPLVRRLKWRLAALCQRSDFPRARKRALVSDAFTARERELLREVDLRIHERDSMYVPTQADHYLAVGISALRSVDAVLSRTPMPHPIRSVLDFPSGYGRVLRFLKARFPDAAITALELEPDAVSFCRNTFGVDALESQTDFASIHLQGSFDLIWCGSLVTHLAPAQTLQLLRCFRRHLTPDGVCIFTSHGRRSADWIARGDAPYGLTRASERALLSDYVATGYGYVNYSGEAGYGVSLVSPTRMGELAREAGLTRNHAFLEAGWDNHQDVYGFAP